MKLFFTIAFCGLSVCLLAQISTIDNFLLFGKYNSQGYNTGAALELRLDGTFSKIIAHSSVANRWENKIEGEFGIKDSIVHFYPKKLMHGFYKKGKWEEIEISFDTFLHVYREQLFFVKYKDALFLLSHENLSLYGKPCINDFFRLTEDFKNKSYSKDYFAKEISEQEFKQLESIPMLDTGETYEIEALTANLISIEKIKNKPQLRKSPYYAYLAEIDKGKADGIKRNMHFLTDDNEVIKIAVVNEKYSVGYIYHWRSLDSEKLPMSAKTYKTIKKVQSR